MNSLLEPATFDVTVDGRLLQVVTRGDPTAPAVVLVHGIRDHARSYAQRPEWAHSCQNPCPLWVENGN